jgi:hypothetical protein
LKNQYQQKNTMIWTLVHKLIRNMVPITTSSTNYMGLN